MFCWVRALRPVRSAHGQGLSGTINAIFYHMPIDPRAQTKPQPQSWCLALTLDLRSSHFRPAALCVLLMGHFSPSLELLIGSSPCLSPLEDPVVAGAGVGLAKGAQTPWKSH